MLAAAVRSLRAISSTVLARIRIGSQPSQALPFIVVWHPATKTLAQIITIKGPNLIILFRALPQVIE